MEDYYLMLQISKKYKMKYIDEVLYSYRWHSSNTIKQIEKMRDYDDKTRQYEEEILNNISEKDSIFEKVMDIKRDGVLYKKQGIPFIFQVLTYREHGKKKKVIKIFNLKIFKYTKKIK